MTVGGLVTSAFTATLVLLTHPLFVASAKKVVLSVMVVVKLVPLPILVAPVELEYQFIVPIVVVACSVTVPAPHLETGELVFVILGIVFIVAVTAVLVVEHPAVT